ncbi:MAG: AAA family ATPase, partial [Nitrososphaera sp.]
RSKVPKVHQASEALIEQPPIDWIVNPLFSTQSVNIIVGEGGSKKTYCLLDMMICIATGKDWLGMKTQQNPCLFIDEESGNRRMLRRLHELLVGHGIKKSIPLYYTSLEQFNFRDKKQVEVLNGVMGHTKSKFVVIDALADVILGADENSTKDVLPVFNFLRSLSESTGSCLNIIHHTNRAGKYRGSSSIQGAVDMMLGVESNRKSSTIKFESLKERDVAWLDFSASITFHSNSKVTIARAQPELNSIQSFTLHYFIGKPHTTISDLLKHNNGHAPESIRKAVYDLSRLELIERTNNGGRGTSATYAPCKGVVKKSK